eukprot:1143119-Pelagomonas_calceolata.AAC.3
MPPPTLHPTRLWPSGEVFSTACTHIPDATRSPGGLLCRFLLCIQHASGHQVRCFPPYTLTSLMLPGV